MVLARVANYFSPTTEIPGQPLVSDGRTEISIGTHNKEGLRGDMGQEADLEAKRPPYLHVSACPSWQWLGHSIL